jgi:hypothetical protein
VTTLTSTRRSTSGITSTTTIGHTELFTEKLRTKHCGRSYDKSKERPTGFARSHVSATVGTEVGSRTG